MLNYTYHPLVIFAALLAALHWHVNVFCWSSRLSLSLEEGYCQSVANLESWACYTKITHLSCENVFIVKSNPGLKGMMNSNPDLEGLAQDWFIRFNAVIADQNYLRIFQYLIIFKGALIW